MRAIKLRNQIYYGIKPFLPSGFRLSLRRWFTQKIRKQVGDSWLVAPGSEQLPDNWKGWPLGKKFAFVLTHDVEGPKGLNNCRQMMDLEMKHGFRSSINFIPEAFDYKVPVELREELVRNGFEVGVHDLHHDGKLYRTRQEFLKKAARINHYLKEWNAEGFRSGFMHRNLDWLHDLNVAYDASTFDTDPFEPQPDGLNTIFPAWIYKSKKGSGYVELPYTLPQDSTIFILLKEKSINIWKDKLDWIAKHGGMALVNSHPDYMVMNGTGRGGWEYPVSLYEQFLKYVSSEYSGAYWHPLPRELAAYWKTSVVSKMPASSKLQSDLNSTASRHPSQEAVLTNKKIWIDLENTPHVPFFKPIIKELERRGYSVILTARDAFQVCELATQSGLTYVKIGRHYGKNRLFKILGLGWRCLQLIPFFARERPVLGLSHGSRAQILLCNLLRIPTVMIMDYEHAQTPWLLRPRWEIVPEVLFNESLHCKTKERIRKYSGIKEDVYAPEFRPDPVLRQQLHLNNDDVIVTVRPPATEAHYHNPESDAFFVQFMDRVFRTPGVKVVLLPRNKAQEAQIKTNSPQWFKDSKVVVPQGAVDGLNLLWYSDLVVSGGGTMNREAAALGVPVYSIFRGKGGAVDRHLQSLGKLILIESIEDVENKILLKHRNKTNLPAIGPREALRQIVEQIEDIIKLDCRN